MYPDAYIQFLVHFHGDRDYFECHEILEEYWKETIKGDKQSIWVGLIMLAVSNYHFRRNNNSGAQRTLQKAISIFENKKKEGCTLGIDMDELLIFLPNRVIHIHSGLPYTSFNIPLIDQNLLAKCKTICKEKGHAWGMESNLEEDNLIHRHLLRDRSEVIQEREIAKKEKAHKKGEE
ncbi:DUF309 domain-containing protein [Bacillus sp. 1NLA3E]|uniref:DUF309 domain-containing protein n=1 Tax=Bacillus sp. 1NLA3E TaxID=666686 RepID=UPI000247E4D5|nr:DUF309 domain-containing protein [Bacillus sp. 1NLA3E]AGK54763.1 hypothetical protein B1NLA3E_15085 [Bacillus sp. 1NLA3E]